MLRLRLSNASRALFIILKFILFPGKSSRFWLPLRPVRANGGPKVQMSYPELFWNNPLKLNWVSAAFEILISQGCFDSDNPPGRKLCSEVQQLPEVKLSVIPAAQELSFIPILSARQLRTKA